MKQYELSTALLNHILCVGGYETIFSGDFDYDYAVENFLEDHPNFVGDDYPLVLDNELNENEIIKALGGVLDDFVKPFLERYSVQEIVIGGWYHPRYYNFATDSLDLDFEVADDFTEKAISKIASWRGNEKVAKYIYDNYKSRDGFMSFSPESLEELATSFRSGNPNKQAVGEYLTLLLYEEFGSNFLQEELEENYLEKDTCVWCVENDKVA